MNLKYRVQNFWKYFEQVRGDLECALRESERTEIKRILDDLNHRLEVISGCKIEVEMSETGFYELTFATGGNKTAQYCGGLLKKDAPKALADNWIVNAFRQPLSALAMYSVLDIKGIQYTGADFKVYYTIDEENKVLHTKIYCEGLIGMEEDYRQQLVAHMLELFIGELELEARIASVEIIDEPSDEENVCLLPNFYEDICDIIIDQAWMEYHDPTTIYMAYKLDQELTSQTLRKDMKLIVTTNPLLQEEVINKEYDSCKDLADKGGEYGFLYYEVLYEDEKEALVRQQLEKELNDLLYPMSIGRTMGGAIGVHYSYIDVALFDKDAFQIVLEKLNETLHFPIYYQAFL